MKKTGDSCNFAKQLFPICFVVFAVLFTGVTIIKAEDKKAISNDELKIASYVTQALDMPTKVVDESGNVISSSNGFVEKDSSDVDYLNKELNESAKKFIDNVFDGTYILNIMKNSDLGENQKSIISSLFEEKTESQVGVEIPLENIEDEEENIVIASNDVPGEEIIEVEQVAKEPVQEEKTALAPGQESVWLYEESQVPDNYITYYDMTATAYCLCKKCTGKTPGSSGYGRTSSGLVIVSGTSMKVCAVNKNQIPLGTHIYVQGLKGAKDYGYAVAADTGGAITTNRIDLYFDNHSTCLQWGRRSVRVYILPEE